MNASDRKQLRVVICGGGIASLCLAHALSFHPHLHVNVFEASDTLRDEGAAVGLGSNAQQALRLISPQLEHVLEEVGGTRMDPSVRVMMGTGPHSGQHIGDIRPAVAQVVVHRGSLLRALRRQIPDGVLEMGRKVTQIETVNEQIHVHFEDRATCVADVLVGCDGINSIVREMILGVDHPAAKPKYTGGYNHRIIIPLDTAVAAFGPEYCSLQTQHGWVGDRGFLLTDFVDNATAMQVIAGRSTAEIWPHASPYVPWPKERLEEDLADWGAIGKSMTKVFTEQSQLYAAGGRVHGETSTFYKDHMCIVGDAAQSFSPFQGAGTGQAIEDVLILQTVLGLCKSRADVNFALQTYNAIRHPRRVDVAASSMWAAKLFTGRDPDAELDIDKIAACLKDWGSNIYDYDLIGSQREAQEKMRGRILTQI